MCVRVYAIKLTYHSTTEAILLSTLAVLLLQLRAVGTEGGGGQRDDQLQILTGQLNLFQSKGTGYAHHIITCPLPPNF